MVGRCAGAPTPVFKGRVLTPPSSVRPIPEAYQDSPRTSIFVGFAVRDSKPASSPRIMAFPHWRNEFKDLTLNKKAVQFGAGNIGRGFLGQLYYESGYDTTFVDVVPEVIAGLNERGAYPLRIVGETVETLTIGNASAVHASDADAVARVLAEADLASTAVGVPVLPKIAPAIAAGVALRFADPDAAPLNIIVCENLIDAGPFMREQVRGHLDTRYHEALDAKVGFVEASIGRMVPIMTETRKRPRTRCWYASSPIATCRWTRRASKGRFRR